MTPLLNAMRNSVFGNLGYPIGALVMVATGVCQRVDIVLFIPVSNKTLQIERAFIAHSTGFFKPPGDFSLVNVAYMVDQYLDNLQEFPEHRWERILTLCKAEQGFKDSRSLPLQTMKAMDAVRRNLYVPSP
jgi:hypothetical protein